MQGEKKEIDLEMGKIRKMRNELKDKENKIDKEIGESKRRKGDLEAVFKK